MLGPSRKASSAGIAAVLAFGGCSSDGPLVVNEIQAHGSYQFEFVEIANQTDQAADISGWGVTQLKREDGTSDRMDALRFPDGTVIAPYGHLLVMTNRDSALGPGPHDECIDGIRSCFYAPFGVSATEGETIVVLSPDDVAASTLSYPANATPDSESSWARLPDIFGDPTVAQRTPGAANEP
jgi:hypothetical protein